MTPKTTAVTLIYTKKSTFVNVDEYYTIYGPFAI